MRLKISNCKTRVCLLLLVSFFSTNYYFIKVNFCWRSIFSKAKLCTMFLRKVSRSQNKFFEPKTSPQKQTKNLFLYPDDPEILETWIWISCFKYFQVVRIEKQIHYFIFGRSYSLTIFYRDILTFNIRLKMLWSCKTAWFCHVQFCFSKYQQTGAINLCEVCNKFYKQFGY